MVKSEQKISLNGQQYEIVDQVSMRCYLCNRIHSVLLLSRDFSFTIGGFVYKVKHECFYCTALGEIFVDKKLKDSNQEAINKVVFPFGTSINSRR